jgi:hypothetical protein
MADDQPIPPAPQTDKDADNKAGRPESAVPPPSAPEAKAPPSHPCYEITREKKRDGWDYAKFFAELIGLGFLITYTLYTAGIYCANRTAAKATQDTFHEIQKQTTLQRQQLVASQVPLLKPRSRFPKLICNL